MITLFKDDYETPIVIHAKTDGRVIPLIGADVFFDMIAKSTNKRVGGGRCEMLNVALGLVKYTFKEGELRDTGDYQGKVKIDLTQGAHRESIALEFVIVDRP